MFWGKSSEMVVVFFCQGLCSFTFQIFKVVEGPTPLKKIRVRQLDLLVPKWFWVEHLSRVDIFWSIHLLCFFLWRIFEQELDPFPQLMVGKVCFL